jgi:hypothetical protein
MSNPIYEYLYELESLKKESIPLRLKEVLMSAPCQVKVTRELLDWIRQACFEGLKSGYSPFMLEHIIRTIAIDGYYSPLQIQAALDKIHVELQNQARDQEQFKRISRN